MRFVKKDKCVLYTLSADERVSYNFEFTDVYEHL